MVTGVLAERACGPAARFKAHRSGNDIAEGRLAGVPVTLARPRSYMNLSGRPVAALTGFCKIPPGRLVVVHDELDLPPGKVRVKVGGTDAGHNGLRSISEHLGRDYRRVRVGTIWADFASVASLSRRGSGTATSPTFGSMVQNG